MNVEDPNPQSAAIFSEYLSTRKVLIADPNGPSRVGIARMMVNLGAKTKHLLLADDHASAVSELTHARPELMISEYSMPDGNGIDLAQQFRRHAVTDASTFVLLTANATQSVVAQAAEGDVDMFLLKPYTLRDFTAHIVRVVLGRLHPSDYLRTIAEGKRLLAEGKATEAVDRFKRATALNASPALAWFHHAQAELYQQLVEGAGRSYRHGLQHNAIHYRCLSGLFDLLLQQGRLNDAYAVVKKLAHVFPANPQRIFQVFSLAVETGNIGDIEEYYRSFQGLEHRNDELVKYVCAALVVCARHFHKQGDAPRSKEMLHNAAVSAAGRITILREIVRTSLELGQVDGAKATLARFPPATQSGVHFLVCQFLVRNATETDAGLSLHALQRLDAQGVADPVLDQWRLRLLRRLGKAEEAEEFLAAALMKWPHEREPLKEAARAELGAGRG
jgi:CheY-like chemotaxis protein